MIKRKALRKIFITTLTVFILMVIYMIPAKEEELLLPTNLEVEYLTGLGTHTIYLLNENYLLVKTNVLLYESEINGQVIEIIDSLKLGTNSTNPMGLNSYLCEDIKVNNVTNDNNIIDLDLSEEFKNCDNIGKTIEGLLFSILELGVNGVRISVDGVLLKDIFPSIIDEEVLTKEFGINKKYDITSYSNIDKVVINYVEEIDNNKYYVPVTKYSNDNRDKIKVIIESLSSSYIYEPNLMSYLDARTELINYEMEESKMILNLSDHVLVDDDYILEEVVYSLGYSIMDNFNVETVFFEVNGNLMVTFDKEGIIYK